MNLEALKKYKIRAKKALGQNFLVNDDIVEEIASLIDIRQKNIIEVGPGYGALSEKLLNKKPKSLNLVELDNDMINILQDRVKNGDFNLELVEFKINKKDILKFEPEFNNYSVIANIPYYITSPILRHFLYNVDSKPEKMLILMQRDVGKKIIAIKSSVIGLMVAKKCYVKEVLLVGKENFVPVPKVESSVLFFESHDLYYNIDDEKFLKIIKIGFSAVRKKLVKNFVMGGYDKEYILSIFGNLKISENTRGEDLNINTRVELIKKII